MMGPCSSKNSLEQSNTMRHHQQTFNNSSHDTVSPQKQVDAFTSPVRPEGDAPCVTPEIGSPRGPSTLDSSNCIENTQRRRLSVSTVSCGQRDGVLPHGVVAPDHPTETARSPQRTTSIQKFDDPALELVNEAAGTIRTVTTQMLSDLLREAKISLLVFGAPSDSQQRGFDNKKEEVFGTLVHHPLKVPNVGYACRKGLKPESPNQDDFFIMQVDDWAMYGVFDGHGPYGHDVSSFIQRALPFLMLSDHLFESDPELVMRRSFKKAHHLLEALTEAPDNRIDCTLSGTTATIILHRQHKLYIAHVGDSRGVIATKSGKHVRAINLTTDHKPTRDDEKARIESCGGEVRRLDGDIPHRVFVKNRLYPGLAMSRALGDTIGAAVGVIPDPDIHVVNLTTDVEFVIIATDGVWEFISSQEAVDFVCQKSKDDVQKAAAPLQPLCPNHLFIMQLLVKDPEIHSKTWMLDVPDNATVAEIVGRFLLHRGAGHVSQPCLLRMFYENTTLTEKSNMTKTLEDLKVPLRGTLLQTMWSVNAGHVSSRCKECRAICELVMEGSTVTTAASTGAQNPGSAQWSGSGGADAAAKGGLKGSDSIKKAKEIKRSVTKKSAVGSVDKPIINRDGEFGLNGLLHDLEEGVHAKATAVTHTMQCLERMVTVCLSSTDLVDRLERLAAMKRNQELTDSEFSKAKSRLLE